MAEESKFKRVVLKLSGEALAGEKGFGIDPEIVDSIAKQIQDVTECGLQVAVVNGGGNIDALTPENVFGKKEIK